MKRLTWLCLFCSTALQAQVNEQLEHSYYDVDASAHALLYPALDQASPIRHDGKVFHGYTDWRVDWRFWWWEEPDGRCRITRTETTLHASIILPRLLAASPAHQQHFAAYISALQQHENGHYQIAQAAARAIDQRLQLTAEQSSCQRLQERANQQANSVLQQHVEQEQRYDRDTEYGKTQGAWLRH